MYYGHRSNLGFSLKPPKWLREAAGKIVSGIQISPPGPIDIPLPGGKGKVTVSTGPTGAGIMDQIQQSGPSLAMIGLGALAVFLLMRRR